MATEIGRFDLAGPNGKSARGVAASGAIRAPGRYQRRRRGQLSKGSCHVPLAHVGSGRAEAAADQSEVCDLAVLLAVVGHLLYHRGAGVEVDRDPVADLLHVAHGVGLE